MSQEMPAPLLKGLLNGLLNFSRKHFMYIPWDGDT